MLTFDEKATAATLEKFLAEYLKRSNCSGYVLGLSGGVDSALSAAIAARAVGPEKTRGIIMPSSSSAAESVADARRVAERLEIKTEKIDISPMIEAYYGDPGKIDRVRLGNKMARERMSILFDRAFELDCLVLGTSNRTEICLGYGTLFGDMACSVNAIGMLYKTQVRQMAIYYGLPEEIAGKVPTADLWPGQTDEDELGLEYEVVDALLQMIIEGGLTDRRKLNEAGFSDAVIDRTVALVNGNYFKRHLPPVADPGLTMIPDRIEII